MKVNAKDFRVTYLIKKCDTANKITITITYLSEHLSSPIIKSPSSEECTS